MYYDYFDEGLKTELAQGGLDNAEARRDYERYLEHHKKYGKGKPMTFTQFKKDNREREKNGTLTETYMNLFLEGYYDALNEMEEYLD